MVPFQLHDTKRPVKKTWKIVKQTMIPVVITLMPSFCHVMTGRGMPTASHGKRIGLFRITSSVPDGTWIAGGSEI